MTEAHPILAGHGFANWELLQLILFKFLVVELSHLIASPTYLPGSHWPSFLRNAQLQVAKLREKVSAATDG